MPDPTINDAINAIMLQKQQQLMMGALNQLYAAPGSTLTLPGVSRNTLSIPPHIQSDPRFATNLPTHPSLMAGMMQDDARTRLARAARIQAMNLASQTNPRTYNPFVAAQLTGDMGPIVGGADPNVKVDPVNILAGMGAGSLLNEGENLTTQALLRSALSNTKGELAAGGVTSALQAMGGPTQELTPSANTKWALPDNAPAVSRTEPLWNYEKDERGIPRMPRASTFAEDWPDFGPNPYYYAHGIGQRATGPMERVEELKQTQELSPHNQWEQKTTFLKPGWRSKTQLLFGPDPDDPWKREGFRTNKPTEPLSPHVVSTHQTTSLPPDFMEGQRALPRELPPDVMFHGFNVWNPNAQSNLNQIAKEGVKGGWWSKEPLDFAGPTYAAVSRQHLPPLLAQRHIHESDPDIEYIPKWRGHGIPQGIPPDEFGARSVLGRMGSYGENRVADDTISVHPYHVLLTDEAKNIIGRLGLKRAGKKATELLGDLGELLSRVHEGE